MRWFRRVPENRRRGKDAPPPRDWSKLVGPVLVLSFGLGGLALLGAALVWLDRPLQSVVVEGSFEQVSREEIRAAVVPQVRGGLLSVDIDRIRSAVTALPWVDRVRISRRWPDTITVSITEQVAAARWGEDELLNTRGELFEPGERPPRRPLPRLDGPDGSHWQVAQRYLAVRGLLAERGLSVRRLSLDARRAWRMELSDGLEVRLGRAETGRRLDTFVQVALPVVDRSLRDAAYVDLRYTNGFAVGWDDARADQKKAGDDVQES